MATYSADQLDFTPQGSDVIQNAALQHFQSPQGQAGLNAFKQGADAYGAWKAANPNDAVNFEASLNSMPNTYSIDQLGLAPAPQQKGVLENVSDTLFGGAGRFLGNAVGNVLDIAHGAFSPKALAMSTEEFQKNYPFLGHYVDMPAGEVVKREAGGAAQTAAELSMTTGLPGAGSALGRIGGATAVGALEQGGNAAAEGMTSADIAKRAVLGAATGAVISGAIEGVRALPKLWASPKLASFLTNIPESKYQTAAASTSGQMAEAGQIAHTPGALGDMAQDIYDHANALHSAAQEAWRNEIGAAAEKIDPETGYEAIVNHLQNDFDPSNKVDIMGGKFGTYRANDAATAVLDKVREEFANAPADGTDLIISRQAINNINTAEDRVATQAKNAALKAIDAGLEETGGQAYKDVAQMYATIAGPAADLKDAMEKGGEFSADKGSAMLRQVMDVNKADKAQIISELDKVAGTDFLSEVRRVGAASALQQVAPATGKRIFDILAGLGIAKVPVLGAAVSPMFWSGLLTGSQTAQKPASDLLARLATLLLSRIAEQQQ